MRKNQHSLSCEKDLVEQLKKGKIRAFKRFYKHYFDPLYFFCLKYTGNLDDSQELVQNIFLKIWEKRSHLDSARSFRAYLFQIAANDLINFVKKKKLEQDYRLKYLSHAPYGINFTQEEVYLNDLQEHIKVCLSGLPKQQGKIFRMSREMGMTHAEIAESLGLSVRTVENQIYRALKYLKDHLSTE